jgi:hypothetical protein
MFCADLGWVRPWTPAAFRPFFSQTLPYNLSRIPLPRRILLAVNVEWWNEQFATQVASIGLTEAEAERVILRSPISDVGARFKSLLAEVAETNPERHTRIRRLMHLKMEELQKLQG